MYKLATIQQNLYNEAMEKCQRKVNSYSVTRSVYLMGLFDWKLVNEEKHENAPSVLTFERDENTPYYKEMVEIEKQTSPSLIPFYVLVIPVAIAFIVMTIYLILTLALKDSFDAKGNLFFFLVPAMVLLLADTVLFYFRSKQLMKYLQNEDKIVKEAEEKIKVLREKYGK